MKLCAVSDSLGNLSFKEAAKLSFLRVNNDDSELFRWKWDIIPVVLSAGFAGLIFKTFFNYLPLK